MRVLILTLTFILFFIESWGQDKWEIESVGLSYSFNLPESRENTLELGLSSSYSYSLKTPSIVMSMQKNNFILRSAIGISEYKIDSEYNSTGGMTGAEVSRFNVMLSQKAGYRLINFGMDESFFFNFNPVVQDYHASNHIAIPIIFSISPLIGIEYHQRIKTTQSSGGFDDLSGHDAQTWIKEFNLPALRTESNESAAFLWTNVGVGLEATFLKKVGIFYDLAYNMKILGKSKLNVDHLYHQDIKSNTYTFESKYISHNIGIRYYF